MANARLGAVLRHVRQMSEAGGPEETDAQLLEKFLAAQDQAAFAALVRRHGPMVLRVCRGVLHHEQDAEDAFQVSFLLLARSAGSVRRKAALAGWLHGVAYRTALSARRAAARRRRHEEQAGAMATRTSPCSEPTWREVQAALDEEIQRLPELYRTAFVLCCLEGRGRAEVARELGLKEGTVASRVDRARKRLQERLARRGIALAALLGAAALARTADAAPPALLQATVQAAAGNAAALSPTAAALQRETAGALLGARGKVVVCLLLAAALLAAGTGLAARQALNEKPPAAEPDRQAPDQKEEARTDLFGDALPVGALARVGTLRLLHNSMITALVYAPDGKAVAACDYNGDIRLWDAATGKELRHFKGSKDGSFTLGFSPDGKLLAACGSGDLLVWRLDAGPDAEPRRLAVAHDGTGAIAFSPDGTLLAAARGQALHVWQVDGWRELLRIDGNGAQKFSHLDGLAFFPDSKTLLTAGEENMIRLWDVATGEQLRVVSERFKNLWGLAVSRDGKTLATVKTADGRDTLRLWDMATDQEGGRFVGPEYSCYCLAFAPDGKTVAVSGPNQDVRLLDAATAEERHRWASQDHATRLAFSPDGKTLALGGGVIRFREPTTGKDVLPLDRLAGVVTTVVFAPDGDTLLTACPGASIDSWEATTGRANGPLRGPPPGLTARSRLLWDTAVARDGRTAVSVDSKGTLHLWDPRTGEGLRRLSEPPARNTRLALSADGTVLAAVHEDNTLRLWDATTGKPLRQAAVPEQSASAHALSPDGKLLVTCASGTVQVWDTATLNQGRQFPAPAGQGITFAALSSDARFLAVGKHSSPRPGDESLAVRVWEVATGKEWCRLAEGRLETWSVAFSPDGRTLAEGTSAGEVRLWELASGGLRCRWQGHRGTVCALGFSSDGRRMASGGADGTALVWDVTGLLKEGRLRPVALKDAEMERLWADLAGRDAATAHRALWALAAAPRESVPWLSERLRPAAAAEPQRLAQLLADLDGDEFARRTKAGEELEKLGDLAAPALRRALEGKPSAEVRRRAEELLQKLERPTDSPDLLRGVRAVEALEQAGTPEAARLLRRVGDGAAEARLTREARLALQRLAHRSASP